MELKLINEQGQAAATLAASIPAGPPPITMTFLGLSAGRIWNAGSFVTEAFTEHLSPLPLMPLSPLAT